MDSNMTSFVSSAPAGSFLLKDDIATEALLYVSAGLSIGMSNGSRLLMMDSLRLRNRT